MRHLTAKTRIIIICFHADTHTRLTTQPKLHVPRAEEDIVPLAEAADLAVEATVAEHGNNKWLYKEEITMGLFKSDKNPCPICGGQTSRLFPPKVEDKPLCKDCDNAISMEDALKKALTLDALREHLDYRKKNAELHKTFSQSRVLDFNDALFLKQRICIDDAQGLWYVDSGENPPVFRTDEMVSFAFKEDERTVIQADKNGYKTQPSVVDSFIKQYGGIVGGLYALTNTVNRLSTNKDKNDEPPKIYAPVNNFVLEFRVNNQYWKVLHHEFSAPGISDNDIAGYIKNYARARSIVEAASQEMLSFFPGAQAQTATADSRGSSAASVADDLKKFKELLDGDIITQEEFNAKKKQLLGI